MTSHKPLRKRTGQAAKSKSTAQGLINPTRSHAADFRKIMPSQMDKLVEQGLFTRQSNDELGRPVYTITKLGRAYLKALEQKA